MEENSIKNHNSQIQCECKCGSNQKDEFLENLCKWVITLNSQIPGYSSNVISIYILMRNQFCNIMLNKSLYDLADFSTLV